MKKFFEYLYRNSAISTILIIIVCTITFIIRENVTFTKQTITFINLMTMGIVGVLLFNSIRKHYIKSSYIVGTLSFLFIFNRLYDEAVFWEVFKFELQYFWGFLGIAVGIVILYPFLKKIWMRIASFMSNLLMKWTNHRVEENDKHKTIADKGEAHVEAKKIVEQKMKWQENKVKEDVSGSDFASHPILFMIIFVLLIVITGGLIYFSVSKEEIFIIKDITAENIVSAVLSLAAVLMLMVFIAGVILSLLIKWFQIIFEIIRNRRKGNIYFVYACGLFLISQYIFSNSLGTLSSVDNVVDILLDGKLFTFPLILSILIPVFLIFTENIISFTKDNKKISNVLHECVEQTIRIAKGIVQSLLTFIEFVTSDFLTTLIEFTREEDFEDKSDN